MTTTDENAPQLVQPGDFLYFDPAGQQLLREDDLMRDVYVPARNLIEQLFDCDQVNRMQAYVLLERMEAPHPMLAEFRFSAPTWSSPYDKVVAGKGEVARRAPGLGTRHIQLVATGYLRPGDIGYFGSDEGDGIRVLVSGFQSFWDVRFGGIIRNLYLGAHDRRLDLLRRVMEAYKLAHIDVAIQLIETFAATSFRRSLDEVVNTMVGLVQVQRGNTAYAELEVRTIAPSRVADVRQLADQLTAARFAQVD